MVTADEVAVVQVHPDGMVTFVRTDLDYELDAYLNPHGWTDAETGEDFSPGLSMVLGVVWRQYQGV